MIVLSLWKGLIDNGATMRAMATRIAERHGLTLDDLKAPPPLKRETSRVRQEAMAKIYATGRFSLHQVRQFFGLSDHTSVRYAVKAHARRSAQA